MKTVLKVFSALAAAAGIVYLIATYGEEIVAWAKKLMECCPCCKVIPEAEEVPAEEAETPAEEAPAKEAPAEETPAEEAPAEETVVAQEADFEQ